MVASFVTSTSVSRVYSPTLVKNRSNSPSRLKSKKTALEECP